MGSFGLTVALYQSYATTTISLHSSPIIRRKNLSPNQTNLYPLQSNFTSGSECIHSKTQKVGNLSSRVKASSEGTSSMSTTTIEKLGVKIEKNPPESRLSELGVRQWPKWGCPPSNFPWTYDAKETCYVLQGKVKVYPEGSTEPVEIGAGDLVVFPKGMKCTWDVSETVDKHYNFE